MPRRRGKRGRDIAGAPPVRPDFGGFVATAAERRRWRRQTRSTLLSNALAATASLPWSPALIELLAEEMFVADALEELLGVKLHSLDAARYPQAIALALVLRHSWQPDDLRYVLDRLGLLPETPREG